MLLLEHLKESVSEVEDRVGAAWQPAMSVMYKISKFKTSCAKLACTVQYKISKFKIHVQNWSVQCSTVQYERRFSRPSSSVQSREKLLDQAEVASDGELQAFRYAVLHLEAKQGAE